MNLETTALLQMLEAIRLELRALTNAQGRVQSGTMSFDAWQSDVMNYQRAADDEARLVAASVTEPTAATQ